MKAKILKPGLKNILSGSKFFIISLLITTVAALIFIPVTGFGSRLLSSTSVEAIMPDIEEEEGLPVLMYHHLAPPDAAEWIFEDNEAVITTEQFQQQMELLAELDYETLTASDLRKYIKGEKDIQERSVVLTFDDGYESNYHYAYPELKKHDHHALFFIIISYIEDNKEDDFDPEVLTHMSWEQLEEMIDDDVAEVHHHSYDSHTHKPINKDGFEEPAMARPIWLEDEERRETEEEYRERIRKDIRKGKEVTRKKLGQDPWALAYPYGRGAEDIAVEAKRESIRMGIGIEPGWVQPGDDIWDVNRINVSPGWSLENFAQALGEEPEVVEIIDK